MDEAQERLDGKTEGEKKINKFGLTDCQVIMYSRRSLMIHYGADVSSALVWR